MANPALGSTTPTTQSSDVRIVKSKNLKGPRYLGEKNKGKCKKVTGGNDKKYNKKVKWEKGEKKKVKFP